MSRNILKKAKSVSFFLLLVATYSCGEFQETQIDQDTIEILVPRDSLRSEISTQLFRWYELEGALEYEFQLVHPSFTAIDRLIVDSVIQGNKFTLSLQPGEYEWRIRGWNNSSSTPFVTRKLFIDTTTDLTNQEIILLTPLAADTSRLLSKSFSWEPLYNADQYTIEVYKDGLNGVKEVEQTLSQSNLNFTFNQEGGYYWRVKASNTTSESNYFERGFFIDTTSPAAPSLTRPLNNQLIQNIPIQLEWNRANTQGASVYDSLFIASDSSFLTPLWRESLSQTTFQIDTLSSGQYFWKVKSIDKAGNQGEFSSIFSFQLQ